MPARIGEDAQVGAVNQGFEHAVDQAGGGRDGGRGQHGAVEPPDEQAGDNDHRGQRGRRQQGTRSREPRREILVAAEHGDDRRVDGMIEPVRRGLMGEQRAEDGDEDCAANADGTRPGTGGVREQRPGGP